MLANLNFALFFSLWRVQVFVGVTLFTYEFFFVCFLFFCPPERFSVEIRTYTGSSTGMLREKSNGCFQRPYPIITKAWMIFGQSVGTRVYAEDADLVAWKIDCMVLAVWSRVCCRSCVCRGFCSSTVFLAADDLQRFCYEKENRRAFVCCDSFLCFVHCGLGSVSCLTVFVSSVKPKTRTYCVSCMR